MLDAPHSQLATRPLQLATRPVTTTLRPTRLLALAFACLAACGVSGATAAVAQSWQARWIAAPGGGTPNSWHAFRHEFELGSAPARTLVRIAASDKYWLWVNGRRVVFEGQLKRGPTPEATYYDTLDIAPYLEEGRNTVAALVWYWHRSGYSHSSTGQPGFLFEADLGERVVASDASWRSLVLPAYEPAGGEEPGAALPERSIRYDARRAIPGWRQPGFDDGDWVAPLELGAPPAPPWNELVARPVPMWRDRGLRDYGQVTTDRADDGTRVLVARLPYNAQVTPYLKVDAPAGREIDIRTDTYVTSGITTLRSEYVTRDGVQEYESYGWLSGHEVRYRIPDDVEVLELKYRETGYDADFAGRFRSDDPELDRLWTKARRTLYVNMRDNHMDCPDRERAQWYGDLVNQLGQVFYALDAERGPLLLRKALRQMAAWQRDDDALVTSVPYGQGLNSPELPLQMLAAVGWYGLWRYYEHTGDAETLAAVYPAVRRYLGLWSMDGEGLVAHRPGDWAWPDWGEHADYPVLENAWYYLALKGAGAAAAVVGATADTAWYADRMRSIEGAFRGRFWRGDHFRSPDHDGEIDDRANAMVVLAGLAREADHPAVLQVLAEEEHASPYMEKYVLEAMFVLGGATAAMERMKRRYGPMIRSWITTLWEDWEWREWNGYNHAWSGGPLTLLSRFAAGLAPAEPGWTRYSLAPRPGTLRHISAAVATPAGPISTTVDRDDQGLRVVVDAPVGGVVSLSVTRIEVLGLTVNGTDLWTGSSETDEVRIVSADADRIRLELPAGGHTVELAGRTRSVLEAGEVFTLSENPVRSDRVIFHFRQVPDIAAVYTLDGRRVVDLTLRLTEPARVLWDLTNDRGVRVAPGVYLLVARVGDEVIRRRLIITTGH